MPLFPPIPQFVGDTDTDVQIIKNYLYDLCDFLSGEDEVALQNIEITKNSGVVISSTHKINFIEGSNVTLTVVDDPGNQRVNVTIAS